MVKPRQPQVPGLLFVYHIWPALLKGASIREGHFFSLQFLLFPLYKLVEHAENSMLQKALEFIRTGVAP